MALRSSLSRVQGKPSIPQESGVVSFYRSAPVHGRFLEAPAACATPRYSQGLKYDAPPGLAVAKKHMPRNSRETLV